MSVVQIFRVEICNRHQGVKSGRPNLGAARSAIAPKTSLAPAVLPKCGQAASWLMIRASVRSDVTEAPGGAFGRFPFLKKLFADGGYQGPVFDHARKKILHHLETEIVKRCDTAVGFITIRSAQQILVLQR